MICVWGQGYYVKHRDVMSGAERHFPVHFLDVAVGQDAQGRQGLVITTLVERDGELEARTDRVHYRDTRERTEPPQATDE